MGILIPDSPEIIQAKRRIMLDQPHLETKSGRSVTIRNDVPKIDSIRLFTGPNYQGSGVPSGDNVRTIGGVYWPAIYIDGTWNRVSSANTQGTYGGIYDTKTGILTNTWSMQTVTGGSAVTSYSNRGDGTSIFWLYFSNLKLYNDPDITLLSNMFTWAGQSAGYSLPVWSFSNNASYPQSCYVKVPTSVLPADQLAGAKKWVANNNVQVAAPYRYTPSTVNIGPKNFVLGRGTITITIDERKIDDPYFVDKLWVTYWTH